MVEIEALDDVVAAGGVVVEAEEGKSTLAVGLGLDFSGLAETGADVDDAVCEVKLGADVDGFRVLFVFLAPPPLTSPAVLEDEDDVEVGMIDEEEEEEVPDVRPDCFFTLNLPLSFPPRLSVACEADEDEDEIFPFFSPLVNLLLDTETLLELVPEPVLAAEMEEPEVAGTFVDLTESPDLTERFSCFDVKAEEVEEVEVEDRPVAVEEELVVMAGDDVDRDRVGLFFLAGRRGVPASSNAPERRDETFLTRIEERAKVVFEREDEEEEEELEVVLESEEVF